MPDLVSNQTWTLLSTAESIRNRADYLGNVDGLPALQETDVTNGAGLFIGEIIKNLREEAAWIEDLAKEQQDS